MASHDGVQPGDDPGHVTVETTDTRSVTGVRGAGTGFLELRMALEARLDVAR